MIFMLAGRARLAYALADNVVISSLIKFIYRFSMRCFADVRVRRDQPPTARLSTSKARLIDISLAQSTLTFATAAADERAAPALTAV